MHPDPSERLASKTNTRALPQEFPGVEGLGSFTGARTERGTCDLSWVAVGKQTGHLGGPAT
ncbi:hypothetical protein E2C01_034753 [Portunus trituberculatus]|uniref:Uncharacterized protein n=1 Tax=Portunus trituberculatus TaxID=210409 RepID=A0A5B7F7S1_PORTR|nr:hypothetical protein [Portunus trituberculatus]